MRKPNITKVLPHYLALGAGAGLAGTVQGYVSKLTEQLNLETSLGENAKYLAPAATFLIGVYAAESVKDKNLKSLATGIAAGSIGAIFSDAMGSINGLSESEISAFMNANTPAREGSISDNISGDYSENISGNESDMSYFTMS